MRVVKRAYKYRFYPTPEQAGLLNRTFGSVRYVYNRALAERSRAWTQEQRRVTFAETCRMLTGWKNDPGTAWLYEVSNVALQQGLQHLQNAYVNFWAKRAEYPTFKSRHRSRASATFTTSGFRYRDGQIWLAKMPAPLDIRWSRPLPEGAEPSTVTVSRDAAGRWHISILVECPVQTAPAGRLGGGDRRGDHVPGHAVDRGEGHQPAARAPRPGPAREGAAGLVPQAERLREPGQGPRQGGPRARPDHRPAPGLPAQAVHQDHPREPNGVIEDLSVRNMVRNHSLARAISDAAWSELRRQLEYKADWYGRDRHRGRPLVPELKTCSACGHLAAKMPLNVREWACAVVRHAARPGRERGENSTGRRAGGSACGDGVRPPRA